MTKKIKNCYDSHTHFWATGQVSLGLQLYHLNSADDLQHIQIKPEYKRADWLYGFGWDQNKWPDQKMPDRKKLDQFFPDQPVFFSRVDGHTSWINTKAIEIFKSQGFRSDLDPKSFEDGLLKDQMHIQGLLQLPDYTNSQHQSFLLESQKIFNRNGFTHVRDLSMTLQQWKILLELYHKKELTVCLDSFVTAENLQDLDRVLIEIQQMRQNPCDFLKVHGVKIFIDGSLGSQTAYLSQPYLQSKNVGTLLWSHDEITLLIKKVWSEGLEVAVHTIGDQAVHDVVKIAREISAEGTLGRLHLEHVQILRPETLQMMKPLHITCHLQPCHWLSDEKWLADILPKSLQSCLFPWEALRKNKIHFDFGSDSPIEPTSLFKTESALRLSAEKNIPALQDDWTRYHSHPLQNWTDSWTEFNQEGIQQVYFHRQPLL